MTQEAFGHSNLDPSQQQFSMAETFNAPPVEEAVAADPSLVRDVQIGASREQIQDSFSKTGNSVITMMDTDPKFAAYCEMQGVSPFNSGKMNPDFARVVAEYAGQKRALLESRGAPELHLDTLSIAAATPNAMAQQTVLDAMGAGKRDFDARRLSPEQRAVYDSARTVLSEYNGLIRNFAETNPAVDVADIGTAAKAVLKDVFFAEGNAVLETKIDDMLRGAQHEMVFGQILKIAGRSFRESTTVEDLRGVDYVIDHDSRDPINVDVKASKNKILELGFRGPWGRRRNGDIVMQSCVPDRALDGKFFIDEATAAQVAPVIEKLLYDAQHNIESA